MAVWKDFAPGLGIFTGNEPSQLRLVRKDASDLTWGAKRSVSFVTSPLVTYYVMVNDGVSDPGGIVNLTLQFTPYAILPDTVRNTEGEFSFTAVGEAGVAYRVEISSDLQSWSAAADGSFVGPEFRYRTTLSSVRNFYRLRPVP